ncbi:OmpH family outer membrane protein [Pseudodesulfovibrio tunisiensis]|uniref:OmpH family outer membrane protein n=1 Tax=Pseudodesulfovibrio tunisiensis TaxID=463192 RepID=UPI001FB27720|nr:OmpH family outer membrane protein [Pseudodesulfovibrio tunisiensis]
MKRHVAACLAALLCLSLLAGCNQPSESTKVAVIDETAAFQKNKASMSAMEHLQKIGAPLQQEAEAAYKAMQDNQNEDTVKAYKEAMSRFQTALNAEQQRVITLLSQEFDRVLEKYRAEKGYALILSKQAVPSFDKTVDITDEIVAEMDKLNIDLTMPEAPKAAATENAEQAQPETEATTEAPAETPAN